MIEPDISGTPIGYRCVTVHAHTDSTVGRVLADVPERIDAYIQADQAVPAGHMVQLHVIVAVVPVSPPEPEPEPEQPIKVLGRRVRMA